MRKFTALLLFFSAGAFLPFFSLASEKNPENSRRPEAIIISINGSSEEVSGKNLDEWFEANPELYRRKGQSSEIFNTGFCPQARHYCDFVLPLKEAGNVSIRNVESVRDDKIKLFLNDLARRTDKDPIDAKFQVEEGRVAVFSLSENGSRLEIEESFREIKKSLGNFEKLRTEEQTLEISLISQAIKPQVSSSEVDNLGISELVGEGKSNFRGSPKNRIHNIRVATSRFNGVLIRPGEEFSFVEILGEVDGEHGYLPELVIKHDKTEPEFGGGICQVSTTVFRAAIYSGLKITARRNHAYPVQYYNPQGLDATVYIPRPDLRFINNTSGHILIQTVIEGTELIFRFYGFAGGRTVEIDGPKVLERNPDGSMKTVFTQRVLDKNGVEILKDVFMSNYDSPAKYPHPGQEEVLKEKPKNWSDREWKEYKKAHGM